MVTLLPLIQVSSFGCNLRCRYYYYHFNDQIPRIMNRGVLDKLTKEVIQNSGMHVYFCWHGGEPTLAGLDFFQEALDIQQFYKRKDQKITNSIQTNGVLVDEKWIEFFSLNNFQIGISLDGPKEIHDCYRKDRNNGNSFNQVIRTIGLLRSDRINFGVICVLTDKNVNCPEKVYDFFVNEGIENFNFGLAVMYDERRYLEPFSITPKQFEIFMIGLFEKWMAEDNPNIKIPRLQDFVRGVLGQKTTCCEFNDWCHHYLMFDYDGTVRACCSLPQNWVVGNITSQNLPDILSSPDLMTVNKKIRAVRQLCRGCKWQKPCRGGCPGYSFLLSSENGHRNYFCSSYKNIYRYLQKRIKKL